MASKAERREAIQNRFKAMSHPLRAEILRILNDRTASSVEMARELEAKVGDVSHHVNRLVELGCAELVKEQKVRGAVEHFHRATERHLIATEEWEELDSEIKLSLVGEFMQKQIDDFVASAAAGLVGSDEHFHLTRTLRVFDEAGRDKALEIHERARLEIEETENESTERLAESGEAGLHFSSTQGCIPMPPAQS